MLSKLLHNHICIYICCMYSNSFCTPLFSLWPWVHSLTDRRWSNALRSFIADGRLNYDKFWQQEEKIWGGSGEISWKLVSWSSASTLMPSWHLIKKYGQGLQRSPGRRAGRLQWRLGDNLIIWYLQLDICRWRLLTAQLSALPQPSWPSHISQVLLHKTQTICCVLSRHSCA